ncbi:hypothetical protein MMC08_007457 [Hypocenomyce scalaris]|nr:hypothetical protein [Hypocenomyce scalaris]
MPHDDDNYGGGYTIPDNYANLNELAGPTPVDNPRERRHHARSDSLEGVRGGKRHHWLRGKWHHWLSGHAAHNARQPSDDYETPDNYANLSEIAGPEPEQNPDEQHQCHQEFLEDIRTGEHIHEEHEHDGSQSATDRGHSSRSKSPATTHEHVSNIATHLHAVSCLRLSTIRSALKRHWDRSRERERL